MKVNQWLNRSETILKNSKVDTPRLDSELILATALGCDRSWLHAHGSDNLEDILFVKDQSLHELDKSVMRRSKHEPLAYILGYKEFYGRVFYVDKNVLVPRPETEEIIQQLLNLALPKNAVIGDVGCGSGALGVTAALELRDINIHIVFLDIDEKALTIAERNSLRYSVQGKYYQGDLISAHMTKYDVLLCNLPYIPDRFPINKDAGFEPQIALYSGDDGLDHYRKLFKQLASKRYGNPIIITETLPEQHNELKSIAKLAKYDQVNKKDLVQLFSHIN